MGELSLIRNPVGGSGWELIAEGEQVWTANYSGTPDGVKNCAVFNAQDVSLDNFRQIIYRADINFSAQSSLPAARLEMTSTLFGQNVLYGRNYGSDTVKINTIIKSVVTDKTRVNNYEGVWIVNTNNLAGGSSYFTILAGSYIGVKVYGKPFEI